MKFQNTLIGETLGTYILVLFGCGSVATSILFDVYDSIFQIALVWGIGVSLAIYATRHLSDAHLNPAVSVAMVISKRMNVRLLPIYIFAQVLGAFLAGLTLYAVFNSTITNYESVNGIVRGTWESTQTARMFGEYYTNIKTGTFISMPLAMIAEGFGTFLLVLLIFVLTEDCNSGKPGKSSTPLFIGLTVSSVICLVAPLTQAGINPARDFGPRMVAWLFGWGEAAFPDQQGGFFWVYILAPIVGGAIAALLFTKIMEPNMKKIL